ncbi:glyoxylase-like metal-dependent hydrolase (beta-lactamase superfamily II) [Gillisia sp. Hel_I_86]|uniref:MBL fold metallo-hydrolase n=1 Tax=Gillisia sp. Hel_I_86 TaxID=1249981 RepID=UPI001199FE7C|nr:MBL fold metallo-hydrolase [Gillisia sp. Hel_I_86]TVZ26067.1 glyoxylase-like metal-dependent hydrolase (beta-lactamase superfamily II) [Gillisia sp. Hel_I_86]
MLKVHHLNCVIIKSPMGKAIGHCLLLEQNKNLVLVDCGIGLSEAQNPEEKLGKELVDAVGFQLDPEITAIKQIQKLGFNPSKVTDCICSHLDPDHIGGLTDFPNARVHVSKEEYVAFKEGNERYLPYQLEHNPKIKLYEDNDGEWFGLPSRKIDLNFETEMYLIPLFGHTLGHCGIAFQKDDDKWVFYVGDAYYLKAEINEINHPIDELASIRAVDNNLRKESLNKVRTVVKKYADKIEYFGYHDPTELILKN